MTREERLRLAAIESSRRLGGADFDPRLTVVGSVRRMPLDKASGKAHTGVVKESPEGAQR